MFRTVAEIIEDLTSYADWEFSTYSSDEEEESLQLSEQSPLRGVEDLVPIDYEVKSSPWLFYDQAEESLQTSPREVSL